MSQISLNPAGDKAWPDLATRQPIPNASFLVRVNDDKNPVEAAVLANGNVALRLDLPQGCVVVAEVDMVQFCGVARAIMASRPDLFGTPTPPAAPEPEPAPEQAAAEPAAPGPGDA